MNIQQANPISTGCDRGETPGDLLKMGEIMGKIRENHLSIRECPLNESVEQSQELRQAPIHSDLNKYINLSLIVYYNLGY